MDRERFTPEEGKDFVAPDNSPEAVEAKELTPIEQLESRLRGGSERLAEKGLTNEAAAIEATSAQVRSYVDGIKNDRTALEEKLGRRLSASDYFVERDMYAESVRVGKERSHISHEPHMDIFTARESDVQRRKGLRWGPTQTEVSRDFSKAGEEELYRALGVIGEDQRVVDLPAVFNKELQEGKRQGFKIDKPLNYNADFEIGVPGVRLTVSKWETKPGYEGKVRGKKFSRIKGESTGLRLDREFLASALGEEKK